MGSGIAQVCASAGLQTTVLEVNETLLAKGLARVEKFLAGGVEKGKMSGDERDRILAKLEATTRYGDLRACDLVIEAIVENADEKKKAYAQVEAVVGPDCLIASNTSSLCVTELAAATKRPDKVAGLHFFNPVPLMKLVEVIRALTTSQATFDALLAFTRAIGKEPIAAPDRGGFIVNRLLVPYLLDAIRCLEEGLGTAEDIDKGMKLGCGYPMGPFTLLDFVGLDTTYYIANILFEEFRESRFAPPPLLKRMVLAGHLGKKSGKGFYDY
jgi:3-hydroxybutyryl-CoA dehydrogenase